MSTENNNRLETDLNRQYIDFRRAFIFQNDGDSTTIDKYADIYTPDQLRVQQEFYRRNRDLNIILAVLLYRLNIVDAAVDAHLAGFNILDDAEVRFVPANLPSHATGMSMVIIF